MSRSAYARTSIATGDAPTAPPVDAARAKPKRQWQTPIPWGTDWIDQNRKFLFIIAIVPFILTFNGRWRIGLDSALYRGLGHALASGKGYHFGEFATKQAYPGLPLLLAGLEKVFGPTTFRPVPVLLLLVTLALLTLAVVYRLMLMHFPRWIAVAVTVALALNARFVSLTSEVLTDIPFLFGLVTALYGWELLRRAENKIEGASPRWRSLLIMCGGLAVAASMRPTFWIVAAAWGIISGFGLLFGPLRRFHLMALVSLLVVWAAMIAVDPRTGKGIHFNPLSGGYEEEAFDALQAAAQHFDPDMRSPSLMARIKDNLPKLLDRHLSAAFTGQPLPRVAAIVIAILLILTPAFYFRRRPLWALLVPLMIAVTLVLSTEPRYYVMIMPLLLLGWILMFHSVTSRIPGGWGDLILLSAICSIVGINISKIIPLVIEQHRVPIWASSARFYKEQAPIIKLAEVVRERTTPDDKIIAPSASVVAYLSDRQVLRQREVLPLRTSIRHAPQRLATMKPNYVVLPWKVYRDKDPEIARLIQRRVLVPGKKIAKVDGGMTLAHARVVVRRGDWREGAAPKNARASLHKVQGHKFVPAHRKAAMRRARERATRQTSATTRPIISPTPHETAPSHSPAHSGTASSKKKKKHSTSSPAHHAPTTAPSALVPPDYWPVAQHSCGWLNLPVFTSMSCTFAC
jgi:hypothetical protein